MNKQQMCRARISTLISLALTREFLILKLYIENHICHTQWWYHPPPPPPQKKKKKKPGGGGGGGGESSFPRKEIVCIITSCFR